MRPSTAAAAAACCASAQAFSNTSPFVMFSTSQFESSPDVLQSSTAVHKTASSFLSSCPTERYLLVSQPNLNVQHLASSTSAPKLQAALASSQVRGRLSVSEMSGTVDFKSLADLVIEACEKAGKPTPLVDRVLLEPLPTEGRYQDLVERLRSDDEDLGVVLEQFQHAGDYTVIYTSGPKTDVHEDKGYEASFRDNTYQELKRDLAHGRISANKRANSTERDLRPLFEKYQFFTPGLFMVFVALLILFSILAVGINGISSLQVPYAAFDKEMGPAAQKKQQ